jgi:hypothetical protein
MTTHPHVTQTLRSAPVALALWLLLTALPALAAQIVEVRVGNHPDFTRVVFELDGMAGYRVETREGAKPELIVTIDASSRVRKFTSKSDGIAAIEVTPQGNSAVAHITLRKPGIRLKEMILANPTRIVLDLVSDKPAPVAKTPPVKPKPAVEQPAPTPTVAKTPAPAPTPAVEQPALTPKPAVEQPALTPKPIAKQPVPTPTPVAKQPVPAPEPIVTAKADPPKPDADPEAIAKALGNALAAAIKPSPDTPTAPPAAEAPKPGAPTAPHPTPTRAVPKPVVQPATPQPQPVAKSIPPPAKSASDGKASGGTPFAIIAGAGAGILLCVVGLVVLLRRRRPQSNDLDVTTIAEAAADPDEEQRSFTDMVFSETDSQSASSESSATSELDSFFDNDDDAVLNPGTRGEDVMNQGISDLPVDRSGAGASPSVPPRVSTSPDPDVLRVVHELERRMGQLETKLGESNEARERLERQVAAQSEELRVQRAAIARTQRALRSLSRGEEEKGTEPALRDDETQAKTRINV